MIALMSCVAIAVTRHATEITATHDHKDDSFANSSPCLAVYSIELTAGDWSTACLLHAAILSRANKLDRSAAKTWQQLGAKIQHGSSEYANLQRLQYEQLSLWKRELSRPPQIKDAIDLRLDAPIILPDDFSKPTAQQPPKKASHLTTPSGVMLRQIDVQLQNAQDHGTVLRRQFQRGVHSTSALGQLAKDLRQQTSDALDILHKLRGLEGH